MKALVLSGGKGTRLRPLTYTHAKQLIPVANKPVLFYGLEAIRDAGITDVGIVVGETRAEIQSAVGDGSRWGIDVTYIEQSEPLGLAHAVLVARDFLGSEPFLMYLGDNLLRNGLAALVREFTETLPDALILLSRVTDPQRFGVVELEEGRVVRLVEKPRVPGSDLALVGVYMFGQRIYEAVCAIRPSGRGELEITDAIQYLVDHGMDVRPHLVRGWWKDTGKVEDLLEANRIVLEGLELSVRGAVDERSVVVGRVSVGAGTEVWDSVIRGPVMVGSNCRVRGSYVGPFTSIGDGVEICDSEIEYSIVLENSVITGIGSRIENSLIGRNVGVHYSERRPRAYQLVLGDNSEVGIM